MSQQKKTKKTKLPTCSNSIESSNEIEDLFESLKSKKKKKNEEDQLVVISEKKKKKKIKESNSNNIISPDSNSNCIISPEPPVHRLDAETGLPVYKAHLLKVGEGGGTKLCPFDCNCCF